MNPDTDNSKGFTLLELLIVLIIVAVMLAITYPMISNFILYPGYRKNFIKTSKVLKHLMNKRYTEKRFPAAFIKFDFKKNMAEIYYRGSGNDNSGDSGGKNKNNSLKFKLNFNLKPFKKLKTYKIVYKNIRLYEIETKGKTYKKGHIFEEISQNYVSPPFKILFKTVKSGKILRLNVNTYTNKIII